MSLESIPIRTVEKTKRLDILGPLHLVREVNSDTVSPRLLADLKRIMTREIQEEVGHMAFDCVGCPHQKIEMLERSNPMSHAMEIRAVLSCGRRQCDRQYVAEPIIKPMDWGSIMTSVVRSPGDFEREYMAEFRDDHLDSVIRSGIMQAGEEELQKLNGAAYTAGARVKPEPKPEPANPEFYGSW